MATQQSLFGATPEALQQQRAASLNQEAAQYAQMDPFQRASFGIYKGANQLGGAVGGMLGGQDPQMIQMQKRQQLLQGVDTTNPRSLMEAAQRASQGGDYPAAQELAARAQALVKAGLEGQKTTADIAASEATAAGKAFDMSPTGRAETLAKNGKFTSESIAKYVAGEGNLVPIDNLTKPTADFAAKAVELGYGQKPQYGQYSPTEVAAINSALLQEELSKKKAGAPKTNFTLPGVKAAGDVVGLREGIQKITKPYQDSIDSADDAISLADMAMATNNFASVATLSRSLAKASGEVQLSKNDVAAYGIDPSLIGSVSDTVSRLSKGRPTIDTLKQLRQLAVAIKAKNEGRLAIEEGQLKDTARVSELFTPEQIDTVFRRRPAAGGTSFGSVKDAEAAKLPRGTQITINGRRAVVE